MNNDSYLIFEKYLNEAKKLAKKDYDKDGKLETPEQEYKGVRGNAIRKARGKNIKKAVKKTVKEAATSHSEQLNMIIGDLKSIIEHANSLKGMLNGDTVIEPWVASKVTIAADYIEGIHDYMKYGTQPTDEDHERTGEGSAEDCERCEKKSESRIVVDNLAQRPGETGNYTNATPNGY